MLKLFLLNIFILSSAYAAEPTQSDLNSIYTEAIVFVSVFGVMGIISFIISRRHAKEYVAPQIIKKEKTQDELKEERISELRNLYANEVLTEGEYLALKEYIYSSEI